jgi:hypothetical protein
LGAINSYVKSLTNAVYVGGLVSYQLAADSYLFHQPAQTLVVGPGWVGDVLRCGINMRRAVPPK